MSQPDSQHKSIMMRIISFFNIVSQDRLSKNAFVLLTTWCMNAAVGFIFIFIAARLYSINAVGVAMLLIAYANIVVLFSRFGIEQSMIRYYNENEKNAIFCSSVLATTIPAIGACVVLSIISYLGFLGQDALSAYTIVLIIAVILLSVSEVSGFFFLANDKSYLYLIQSVVIATRLIFLIIFVSFGILGIFSALVVAMGLSVLFSLLVIRHMGVKFVLDGRKFLTESLHFSLGNYISDFFLTAPIYIIPIIVFSLFGENETAIYSVGYAIASIAFLIPTALGYASFISGCKENTGNISVKKILIPTLILIVGIILVFFIWGVDIIGILGPAYAGTARLVVTIMGASVFALFFQVFSAEFKIRRQIKRLILFNGAFFLVLISLSYLFMMKYGLLGAGYAWIAAYAICVLPVGIYTLMKIKGT